jgi:hypothetical protein
MKYLAVGAAVVGLIFGVLFAFGPFVLGTPTGSAGTIHHAGPVRRHNRSNALPKSAKIARHFSGSAEMAVVDI